MEEESRRNHRGGAMKKESWRGNLGGIVEEESWRGNHGGCIMEESAWRRQRGGGRRHKETPRRRQKAPRRPPGGSRKHPGGSQEAARRQDLYLCQAGNYDCIFTVFLSTIPFICHFHEGFLRVGVIMYAFLHRNMTLHRLPDPAHAARP